MNDPVSTGNILVVDDEPQIHRFLKPALEAAGYIALRADTGTQALRLAVTTAPDLVLLDLGLPDVDGQVVLRKLREFSDVPIIVLSARAQEAEKIMAFDHGADDYVEKPFGVGELLARMRKTIRSNNHVHDKTAGDITYDDIRLIDNNMSAVVGQQEIKLTKTQYRILRLLVINRGVVLTHENILSIVWGKSHLSDVGYLRIYVGQLRSIFGEYGEKHILTRPGIGYYFS
ncbi:response regulator [Acidiphilium sp.]|uniref:response regulator n=1 Tax=Acidiphilium sp. TaxID=527 RepID=UPI003D06651C